MNSSLTDPTDEAVAKRVQAGEVAQFGILVERFEAKMRRYAKKFLFGYMDAEDVVQEVFLKAFANIQSFDATRSFSSWIYRIAHNEFINAIKKRGREPLSFFDPDTLFPHPSVSDNTDRELDQGLLKRTLDACLEQLDAKYREPLVLYFFEDMDYEGISQIMHIPVSTVGVRLARGKQMLKKIYTANHHGQQ